MNDRILAVAMTFVFGCRRREEVPTEALRDTMPRVEGAASRGDASTDTVPDTAPRGLPPTTHTTEAEVRALVDAWLRAQNAGDFAAYERLYAPRFTGVRRSGARVHRFDRAGWMRDRAGMFRAAMRVTARDVVVDVAHGNPTVRFTQEFSQGTYRDVGRKEMVLLRSEASLLIAREEMLDSSLRVPEGGGSVSVPAPGEYFPVLAQGELRYVILGEAQEDWAEGAAELLSPGEVVVSRKAVRMAVLPESFRGYAGQRVRLYDPDGRHCETALGALAVLSRIDVHFGVTQRWQGENPDGTQGTPFTPSQIAAEAFDMGAKVLVARVEGACGQRALWGQLASLPEVTTFRAVEASAGLATVLLRRFRSLPAWRSLDGLYRQGELAARARTWDTHDGAAPRVRVWEAAGRARRFAVVSASTSVGGCGAFSAAITVVFEVLEGQRLLVWSDGSAPGFFEALGAVDLDGDGWPEFVTEEGLVRLQGTVYRPQVLYAVPNQDCPC
jgi:ketosteroid isomerase-like protein